MVSSCYLSWRRLLCNRLVSTPATATYWIRTRCPGPRLTSAPHLSWALLSRCSRDNLNQASMRRSRTLGWAKSTSARKSWRRLPSCTATTSPNIIWIQSYRRLAHRSPTSLSMPRTLRMSLAVSTFWQLSVAWRSKSLWISTVCRQLRTMTEFFGSSKKCSHRHRPLGREFSELTDLKFQSQRGRMYSISSKVTKKDSRITSWS